MRNMIEYAGGLLAAAGRVPAIHTTHLDADGSSVLTRSRIERYHTTLEDADLLGVAVLHEDNAVCSCAFFSAEEDGDYLLKLSNGETYDLNGDLSLSQLTNILCDICHAPDKFLEVSIFTRANDPLLKAVDAIDDQFYRTYQDQTDLVEPLQRSAEPGSTDPDRHESGQGRCGAFSGNCF
jgi:hypothetical protein